VQLGSLVFKPTHLTFYLSTAGACLMKKTVICNLQEAKRSMPWLIKSLSLGQEEDI
jgi:hypothetical protein